MASTPPPTPSESRSFSRPNPTPAPQARGPKKSRRQRQKAAKSRTSQPAHMPPSSPSSSSALAQNRHPSLTPDISIAKPRSSLTNPLPLPQPLPLSSPSPTPISKKPHSPGCNIPTCPVKATHARRSFKPDEPQRPHFIKMLQAKGDGASAEERRKVERFFEVHKRVGRERWVQDAEGRSGIQFVHMPTEGV